MKNVSVDPILRRPQVRELTGLSDPVLYKLLKNGEFPAGVYLTDTAVGWKTSVVQEWIDTRPAVERGKT